jgi:hypothetical protein
MSNYIDIAPAAVDMEELHAWLKALATPKRL